QRDGGKLLELRSRGPLPIALPASHRKVTVLLDLTAGSPDRVGQALNSRLKNYVRRTARAGVTVRFGPDQLRPFVEVFKRHMHELAAGVRPARVQAPLGRAGRAALVVRPRLPERYDDPVAARSRAGLGPTPLEADAGTPRQRARTAHRAVLAMKARADPRA